MLNVVNQVKVKRYFEISILYFVTTAWSCSKWKDIPAKVCLLEKETRRMEKKLVEESTCDKEIITSVHSDQINEIHNVPIGVLIRPFPSILDESKVQSLMDTIKVL